MLEPQVLLRRLFTVAVTAASDFSGIAERMPPTRGRVRVLAAGKAAAAMAAAIEANPPSWLSPTQLDGLVVTPPGHGLPLNRFSAMTAGHPLPTAASAQAGERMLSLAAELGEGDLLVALISGGASALLAAPIEGLTLQDEIELNRRLLSAGAPIAQMNAARARLSRIKAGGLARAAHPASIATFIVSDVPGDDPAVVGGGPTLEPSARGQEDALAPLSPRVAAALSARVPRPPLARGPVYVLRTGRDALAAADGEARRQGLDVINLGADLQDQARALGRAHAGLARDLVTGATGMLVLSGGETTVTVAGSGRGGRNTEYLASFMTALGPSRRVWALAADTDGIDGVGPAAGALSRPDSLERAEAIGLDVAGLIANNDTLSLFEALGDAIATGPTRTNVNDFRAILVLPPGAAA
ncbi:glycerate kinase type-2 family protein [Brevundimonas balnearis]|uniref:Glycerate kinase n=1 Tax=Brevundimonas balnearis TaxID=1572858 RepID=A0ABV6R1M1_9CAUL